LASAASELRSEATNHSLAIAVCDVRSRGACDELIREVTARNGPIDILINNAGVIEVGPLVVQTHDDFREAMDTHFWGPLHTTSAALPGMRARRRGHIVNVSSVGGTIGVPHLAPYSASKFAQIGYTQALAAEAKAYGIAVTSVVPGLMRTGSPDHAIFKGRHRAEYAWFTLSDANPLLSTSADAAARRIMRAIRRRQHNVTIGWTAKAAQVATALLPETTTRLLAVAARLLPTAGPNQTHRYSGAESHSKWTENPLTALNSLAQDDLNQTPLPGGKRANDANG
jgi:short-subunit dehydrogenase